MNGLDGILRPVEATAIAITHAGGGVVGALVIIWDQAEDEALPPPARS